MIEVYKTDVIDIRQAKIVETVLQIFLGLDRISFDLEDRDHILRIESKQICNDSVISILRQLDCHCEVLKD